MIATYSFSTHSASFEFFSWLVMVKAMGADEIVFDLSNPKLKKIKKGKPTVELAMDHFMEKFNSVVAPGPAFAGLKSRQGTDASSLVASHIGFLPWWNSGNRFQHLQTVKPPVKCDYTVTIRNYQYAVARNSNRDAWYKFAEEIGAVLIEDYTVKPIHLHDRVALYAGAKMNFGVCNGPLHMLTLTPYPVTMFVNSESARNSLIFYGTASGTKLPWMQPDQKLIWEEDNLDNLRRCFDDCKL